MGIRNFKKAAEEEENVFWVTMSDLLLGLTMVFMTLFVLTMTGYTQQKIQMHASQSEVAKQLIKKMKEQNVNAQVDDMTGQVKISDLELFDVNSYILTERGKKYLDKFIPIYVNTIFSSQKISDKIENVIIQGHTDSQTYAGISSKEGQFTKNMELSLRRADAVESYIFNTNYDKKYNDKLIKSLVVEGKSYNEPVLVNGKEDYNKSRRVELKLVVKDTNIQDLLKASGIKKDDTK